jgi:two-component system chemotaxis response regulator CheY
MNKPIRVLISDDTEPVRESVAIALRTAGMDADTAASGIDTLGQLRKASYDVLVTDIWMPEMDGVSLIKVLSSEFPRLRIMAMTGGGPDMTIETALSLAEVWGAEHVFVKPFDEARLIEAILAPRSR